MRLAVFDIDGTLIAGPSTEKRFFLWLLRTGRLGPRQVFAWLFFLLRQSVIFGWGVFRKNKAYLAGLCEKDVATWAAGWAETAFEKSWFVPCVARLRQHQAAGDRVALVSGTPDFIAKAIARTFGVTAIAATQCAARAGLFSADPPVTHPFAAAKVEIIRRLAREAGVDPDRVVVYGDSIHDLAAFRIAGVAVAVRPDPALANAAQAEGWEIIGPVRSRWPGAIRPPDSKPAASRLPSLDRTRR
jgi:HAD superfamily phosphoserine phosphatase-like hydrolase